MSTDIAASADPLDGFAALAMTEKMVRALETAAPARRTLWRVATHKRNRPPGGEGGQ